MRTSTAAVGSAAFFVVAPGTFVGLGPWLITHWEIPGFSPPLRVVFGVVLIVLGLIPPVHAFIQFVKAGGTPMPVAPTELLVVTGFNRFVRNPMYVGLLTVILGQALLFDSPWLVLYAVIGWDRDSVIRPLVRRADLGSDVWRAIRGVSPQCARLDAATDALEAWKR